MTSLSTYQNLIERIGIANLDSTAKQAYDIVKEGSNNFSDANLWSQMLSDPDIKETYELHVKALEKSVNEIPPKKEVSKPPTPKSARDRKAKPVKQKPVTARKKSIKAKSKSRKSLKKPEQKFPLTIRKVSKELQLIKRMASLDGKRKTLSSLERFYKEVASTLKNSPNRKALLTDIHKRISIAVSKAAAAGVKEIDIRLEKGFRVKLTAAVKSARPRLKVEYLSGPPEKK